MRAEAKAVRMLRSSELAKTFSSLFSRAHWDSTASLEAENFVFGDSGEREGLRGDDEPVGADEAPTASGCLDSSSTGIQIEKIWK